MKKLAAVIITICSIEGMKLNENTTLDEQLIQSIRENNVTRVASLLDSGVNAAGFSEVIQSPLWWAATFNSKGSIRLLLLQVVHDKDSVRRFAIHQADAEYVAKWFPRSRKLIHTMLRYRSGFSSPQEDFKINNKPWQEDTGRGCLIT